MQLKRNKTITCINEKLQNSAFMRGRQPLDALHFIWCCAHSCPIQLMFCSAVIDHEALWSAQNAVKFNDKFYALNYNNYANVLL